MNLDWSTYCGADAALVGGHEGSMPALLLGWRYGSKRSWTLNNEQGRQRRQNKEGRELLQKTQKGHEGLRQLLRIQQLLRLLREVL